MINTNNNHNTETQKQLSFLGYKKGDTVYLRGFLPANHPDKNKDKGRKSTCKSFTQLKNIADEWEQQGLGVYLVVNGGGHTDNDVKECRALFYEHDNLAKDIQIDLWQSLNLPAPTFQIDTGGKSIHSYWVLSEKISSEDWRKIQSDLLECADADRALKNPSRVMRLAGYAHSSGQKSTIISESGKLYSYEELRKIIPIHQVKQPTIPIAHDISDWGDMRKIATYLDGYKVGGRQGWITCKCPVHNGQSSDSLHINENSGQFHCHAGCGTKEIFKVSLDIAKTRGYIVPEPVYTTVNTPINTTTKKVKPEKTKVDLIAELNSIIDKDLSHSEIEVLFPELSDRTGRNTNDIRRVYEALLKEREIQEEQKAVSQKIPQLLESQQSRLNPYSLFYGDGGNFAQSLIDLAQAMPAPVEHLITTLIPAVGSRMGAKTQIVVKPSADYTQPPVFWSCIIAQKGQKKTPVQKIILKPLFKLEDEEFQRWEPKYKQYKEDLKNYKKNGDEPPTEPAPRARYITQDATSETRIKIHCENPRGILTYLDEWSSFINARNMYRSGKGNDLERDLSEFNGGCITKDTTNERLFLYKSAISRTGSTQTETINKFLSDNGGGDNQAEYARWLFCCIPSKLSYLDIFQEDNGNAERLQNYLMSLYRNVGLVPEKDYFLTNEAKKSFEHCHDRLTDAYLAESNPGLSGAYPKLQSYLCRLTLWVHIVNSVLAGEIPTQMIEPRAVSAACELVRFYESQIKLLFSVNESGITGDLLKVKQFIDKRNGVTIRDIKQTLSCFKKTSTAVLTSICDELVKLKVVNFENKKYFSTLKITNNTNKVPETFTQQVFEPVGELPTITNNYQQNFHESQKTEKVDFVKNSKNVGDVGEMLVDHQHTQSNTQQGLQSFVGDVGENLEENKNIFSTTDIEKIPLEANTELLRSFLGDEAVTWPMILELTDEWTMKWGEDYKKQVFKMLSKAEQDKYREMKREYEKSGVSSQELAVSSHQAPVSNEQLTIDNGQLKTEKSAKREIKKGDKFIPKSGPHAGKTFICTSISHNNVYGKTETGKMISPKPFSPKEIKLVEV